MSGTEQLLYSDVLDTVRACNASLVDVEKIYLFESIFREFNK